MRNTSNKLGTKIKLVMHLYQEFVTYYMPGNKPANSKMLNFDLTEITKKQT